MLYTHSEQFNYMVDLVTAQQTRTNNFVTIMVSDIDKLMKRANTYDMSELEIIEMILEMP